MKGRKLTSLALSASLLLTTSMAWADGWGHDDDHDRGRGPQPHYYHYDRDGRDHDRYREYRDHDDWRRDRDRDRWVHYHHEYRGYPGHPGRYEVHGWHRGDRLPPPYWTTRYVVHDYDYYGLPRPRPGHCWVRLDNSFVLMAVTTGVILSIVADH